jgi:hypothetical protein
MVALDADPVPHWLGWTISLVGVVSLLFSLRRSREN